jgi:hypothetical protein
MVLTAGPLRRARSPIEYSLPSSMPALSRLHRLEGQVPFVPARALGRWRWRCRTALNLGDRVIGMARGRPRSVTREPSDSLALTRLSI